MPIHWHLPCFMCNENPAVKFQIPECCPNGHHLIKWSLQLCQWSICCRPFQFGSLQRNRTRYRIKCTIFCNERLGFVHWWEKFSCAGCRTGPLHWRTVFCNIQLPLWQQGWAGKNLPQVPSREGKTLPVLQQSSEAEARGIVGIFKVFHKPKGAPSPASCLFHDTWW